MKGKEYTIKESGSNVFFIKCKNDTIASFRLKEHAEFFLAWLNNGQLKMF